ncbi:MAG: DinB family protein [Micromonosporaceae bacterium]|nr:DinB family protein [Micromonosporaceae bacterium]
MTAAAHKPDKRLADPKELLLAYLDYFRSVIANKLAGLSEQELRTSRLPSGWTPLELLKHLVYMERRWLRWGFRAEQVPEPWGDQQDGRWRVGPDETLADLVAALHDGGRRTREIVANAELSDPAAVGGRFAQGEPPPSLAWILVHVLEEYARHAGHLDIVRELADGVTGE